MKEKEPWERAKAAAEAADRQPKAITLDYLDRRLIADVLYKAATVKDNAAAEHRSRSRCAGPVITYLNEAAKLRRLAEKFL